MTADSLRAGAPAAAAGIKACAGVALIWRSSWRAIASLKPPRKPVILVANCVSSISVPIFVPELSNMPDAIDSCAARMLFISSCMNSASNCLATSLIAAFGSVAARERSESMLCVSVASRDVEGRFI